MIGVRDIELGCCVQKIMNFALQFSVLKPDSLEGQMGDQKFDYLAWQRFNE